MAKTRNGEIELAYDVEGEGPDLLLIVGSASSRPLWALVRPRLARSFRTIAFDNRDSGESTIARIPYALSDLAADALAVLNAVGSRRAHVLGHSMGGAIAQELALSNSERLTSLTLVCSWARGDVYAKNMMELMCDVTESGCDDRTLLEVILFVGSGITTLREASLREKTDAAMTLGPLAPRDALVRQWQLDLSVDTLARVRDIRIPTHVIWGDEDRLLPQPLSQQLVDGIVGASETRVDGCGHLPMVDAPEAFIDAVASFLAEHRPAE